MYSNHAIRKYNCYDDKYIICLTHYPITVFYSWSSIIPTTYISIESSLPEIVDSVKCMPFVDNTYNVTILKVCLPYWFLYVYYIPVCALTFKQGILSKRWSFCRWFWKSKAHTEERITSMNLTQVFVFCFQKTYLH